MNHTYPSGPPLRSKMVLEGFTIWGCALAHSLQGWGWSYSQSYNLAILTSISISDTLPGHVKKHPAR
jgi:hypothetical protein